MSRELRPDHPTMVALGDTPRFEVEGRADGTLWDFTAAVATLYLRKPGGQIVSVSGSIESPATGGVAYYVFTSTTALIVGDWSAWWKIVDGSVIMNSIPRPFMVFDPERG